MTRQRHRTAASYSSSTLSSTSSGASSTGTYASIKSVSSCASSRLSSQTQQPSNFWNKFDRKTKTYSVLSVLKNIFKHKERGEPSKLSKDNLQIFHISPVPAHSETSFILDPPLRLSAPLSPPSSSLSPSNCPAGLYCVIEDFLTEYDLRLEEEEERAEMIARKTKELKPLTASL